MLKGLLEKSTCSRCKVCCVFDNYDIWETPVFTPDIIEKTLYLKPNISLKKHGECYTFKTDPLIGDELFVCPMLDTKKGCMLGDEKPFECRIWPYRIMELNSQRLIALSPICEPVNAKPLSEIVEFLKTGLAKRIFEYAELYPEIIKKYDSTYPILLFEKTL